MDTRKLSLVKGADTPAGIATDAAPEKESPGNQQGIKNRSENRSQGDAICRPDGTMIANFKLQIIAEKMLKDADQTLGRGLLMALQKDGKRKEFWVNAREFSGKGLMRRVYEVQGGNAIISGTARELLIATQEDSPKDRPILVSHASNGFTPDGKRYLTPPAIEISERGAGRLQGEEVELLGAYGRRIQFELAGHAEQVDLARHIVKDFLELKDHGLTYPLIAHVVLALFASRIPAITGKQKPGMHLQGASGGGKTFLASRAASFFGDFEGHLPSWSSTANAIEALGHQAKDALFVVDDFKPGLVPEKDLLRVLQNHANNQGRSRLKPNGKADEGAGSVIRGLLLSTGEGFTDGVESVAGRTILLDVDTSHNQRAGKACLERQGEYPRLLAGLLHHVLAKPDWAENFRQLVEAGTQHLLEGLPCFPNGLRIASNWALNAVGFHLFLEHLFGLGVISANEGSRMASEYLGIAKQHVESYAERIARMNPTEAFRDILGQKLATGAVSIASLGMLNGEGKCIGKATKDSLYLFPDVIVEMMTRHYAAQRTPMPFTKEALKNSLLREGYLLRMGSGRLTGQIRLRGWKATAWKIRADFLDVGWVEDDEE